MLLKVRQWTHSLNVNIQWHCRVINDKVPVNLYDIIIEQSSVQSYDSRAINKEIFSIYTIVVQSTKNIM